MRKDVLLPALAAAGGALGFFLRLSQWSSGYDPDTQLFLPGHPAVYLLPLLAAALALIFFLLSQDGNRPEDFLAAYRCPSEGCMALKAAAAVMLMGAGLTGALEGMEELALYRADPVGRMVTYPAALLVCALLCLLSGPALLLTAQGAYRGTPRDSAPVLALLPSAAALVWLFSIHMAHSTDPIFAGYGWSMLAAVLLTLTHYYEAAFFQRRSHPRRALLCALMGLFFAMVSLADRGSLFQRAITVGLSLSALTDAYALLRAMFGPPWPKHLLETRRMPERASDNEDDDEDD